MTGSRRRSELYDTTVLQKDGKAVAIVRDTSSYTSCKSSLAMVWGLARALRQTHRSFVHDIGKVHKTFCRDAEGKPLGVAKRCPQAIGKTLDKIQS